jgi:hypothetical protein
VTTETILVDGWRWLAGPSRIHYMPWTTHGRVVVKDSTTGLGRWLTACGRGPYATSSIEHPATVPRRAQVCRLCWSAFTTTALEVE